MPPSTIHFVPALRLGKHFKNNTSQSERHFFDILVDSRSLWQLLGKGRDGVSVLCSEFMPETLDHIERLLLRREAELPDNRRSLFVCGECGDIGCGAVTLQVSRVDDLFIWNDFGYENDYEEVHRERYSEVGPFTFNFNQYESAFASVVEQLTQK